MGNLARRALCKYVVCLSVVKPANDMHSPLYFRQTPHDAGWASLRSYHGGKGLELIARTCSPNPAGSIE
jgi:hypothetical protein